MKTKFSFLLLSLLPLFAFSQEEVFHTFKSTRVINSHSTEVLPKKVLDVRIVHRFGDLAGPAGGWETLFGIENAADILTGFEYGLTDDITIGLSRTKGGGPQKQLLHGLFKYRFLQQKTDNSFPVSLAFVGNLTVSTMRPSSESNTLTTFESFSHRVSYFSELIIARKFTDRFSLQVMPAYLHRNLVDFNDENGLFSLGLASRIQLTKIYGLILDFNYPFSSLRTSTNNYYPALGIGLEIDTGGHIFQINLTNATGIVENDFIPNTRSNWLDGGFRVGFTISRWFRL